jgi:hypothetical protein
MSLDPISSSLSYPSERTINPGFTYSSGIKEIQAMIPKWNAEHIQALKVDRCGFLEASNMTSIGLHKTIQKGQSYQITTQGLIEVAKDSVSRFLGGHALEKQGDRLPSRYAEIEASWETAVIDDGTSDNVLGGNGTLKIGASQISIPAVEANEDDL